MRSFALRGSRWQSRAMVEFRPSAATSTRDSKVSVGRRNRPIRVTAFGADNAVTVRPFANRCTQLARSRHDELIEEAALDGDFRFVASRQGHGQSSAADANELDAIEHAVRQTPNTFRQLEPPQDRPARRVQTIAADLFARKDFSFEEERSQAGASRKRRRSSIRPVRRLRSPHRTWRYCRGKRQTPQGAAICQSPMFNESAVTNRRSLKLCRCIRRNSRGTLA